MGKAIHITSGRRGLPGPIRSEMPIAVIIICLSLARLVRLPGTERRARIICPSQDFLRDGGLRLDETFAKIELQTGLKSGLLAAGNPAGKTEPFTELMNLTAG